MPEPDLPRRNTRDARARWSALAIKDSQLFLDLKDKQTDTPVEGSRLKPSRDWLYEKTQVPLETPPVSAQVRLRWDARQPRVTSRKRDSSAASSGLS